MNPTDPAADRYDGLAERYDRRWSFYNQAALRETLARIDLRPGDRVLDVGCGTGLFLRQIDTKMPGVSLTGLDPSTRMLDVARRRLPKTADLQAGHAESIPFPDGAFTLVVSTSALHYFRDSGRALSEMHRVLQPRGRLVITDWCRDFAAIRVFDRFFRIFEGGYIKAYGTTALRRMLDSAAFEVVRLDRYKISRVWGLMTATAVRD